MLMRRKTRYAVVGLGNITQKAVLPALQNTRRSKVTALISGDTEKLRVLGKRYGVEELYTYDQYEECLASKNVDAVYIALPNHLHREYTERAAKMGVHVLCEKPMALSVDDCLSMARTCHENNVKLMIAYRLHFEKTNLTAIELANSGRIGRPRLFQSIHSMPVRADDIRTYPISMGGGPTYDMGIYDINAARYIFQSEPIAVSALPVTSDKRPYRNIEESMAVTLRFSGERIATLLYSFGSAGSDRFQVVGTKGDILVENAYTYVGDKHLRLTVGEKSKWLKFGDRDQFAAEIDYFSQCVQKNLAIEPSGVEGFADIRIIEAIYESAQTGQVVQLPEFKKRQRPNMSLEIKRPPVSAPELFHAHSPASEEAA